MGLMFEIFENSHVNISKPPLNEWVCSKKGTCPLKSLTSAWFQGRWLIHPDCLSDLIPFGLTCLCCVCCLLFMLVFIANSNDANQACLLTTGQHKKNPLGLSLRDVLITDLLCFKRRKCIRKQSVVKADTSTVQPYVCCYISNICYHRQEKVTDLSVELISQDRNIGTFQKSSR